MEYGLILQKMTKITKKKKKLIGRKKAMYEALKGQLGVITAAAKQIGISRETHYSWLRENENYRRWVEELPELTLDFAENALFKEIKKGNMTGIIFYLKTKGKSRGFIEQQEIKHTGKFDVNHTALTKQEKQELLEDLSNE